MSSLRFAGLAITAAAALLLRKTQKKAAAKKLGEATDEDKPITVAYWKICGLAQSIRLLLAYKKMPFKDVRYELIDKPEGGWSRSAWMDKKFTLGLDFPNLPYIIHGDFKLTESNACLTYVAELAGMAGSNAQERATIGMLLNVIFGFRNAVVGTAYKGKDAYPAALEAFKEKLGKILPPLVAFLGDKDWLCDFGLSAPDFHFYELIRQTDLMLPGFMAAYPTLQAYQARFEALPEIAEYQASPQYLARPCNNKMATFK